MSTAEQPTPAKRRGRRPGGQDTRAALVAAAREVFSESGYEGATVRAIAARAGVDAAMVNHWFGGKEGLFAQAVLQLPFDPVELLSQLMDGPVDELGKRIVRRFLTVWDATEGGAFPALVRSIASHDQAALSLKDFLIRHVLENVVGRVSPDRPELRATLCASQVVGMGMARYVAKFEPFSTTDIDTIAAAVGPTLQRYLTGDID
ncbi:MULTISPECIES: TetR family transcriptional regulator [unclassified Amycolatopsis]|uniref:TetR/AcrR family transcriptional regulator n=1 Tax=unclassified Amycolatopsis TaxID=2618356 RepID=UPI00026262EC|nr:TetR family transcriptional regulator [Amycolatopsis sp. ATCC 39116]